MDINLATGAVMFRVVYLGPEGATKFVNIRGLHSGLREDERTDLTLLHAGLDRIVSFRVTLRGGETAAGLRPSFQVLAVPGKLQCRATERLLARTADAVIFLPERGHPASRASKKALQDLSGELRSKGDSRIPFPVFVQDYLDGEPRFPVRGALRDGCGIECSSVPVAGDTVEAILRVFTEVRTAVIRRFEARQVAGDHPGAALAQAAGNAQDKVHRPGWWRSRRALGFGVAVLALTLASALAWLFTLSV